MFNRGINVRIIGGSFCGKSGLIYKSRSHESDVMVDGQIYEISNHLLDPFDNVINWPLPEIPEIKEEEIYIDLKFQITIGNKIHKMTYKEIKLLKNQLASIV